MHEKKHSTTRCATVETFSQPRVLRLCRYDWITISGLLIACLLLFVHEPALANKFETIGGGVSGSRRLKLDWLQTFLYIVGGMSLFGAFLSVVMPRNNALFLNFANWKTSAVVLLVIGSATLGGAVLL